MASIQFSRNIDPVCSCGNYIGRIQPAIEFSLLKKINYNTDFSGDVDDKDVAAILDDMGIRKMCCRRTVIISPVVRLLQTSSPFNIYLDQKVLSLEAPRLLIGNPTYPKI